MIIVSGKAVVKSGTVQAVQSVMEETIKATRAEAGCIDYSYAIDVLDPNVIVVLEYWENDAALQAHFAQPHMAKWLQALNKAGVISQDIRAFEIASERQLLS